MKHDENLCSALMIDIKNKIHGKLNFYPASQGRVGLLVMTR